MLWAVILKFIFSILTDLVLVKTPTMFYKDFEIFKNSRQFASLFGMTFFRVLCAC